MRPAHAKTVTPAIKMCDARYLHHLAHGINGISAITANRRGALLTIGTVGQLLAAIGESRGMPQGHGLAEKNSWGFAA